MSLPSQAGHPKSRRNHMYSRRRGHPFRWIIGSLAAVAIAVGFWWFWPGNDHTDDTNPALSQTTTLDAGVRDQSAPALGNPVRNPMTAAPKTRESHALPLQEKPQSQQNTRPTPTEPMKLVMGEPQAKPSALNQITPPRTQQLSPPPQDVQPQLTEQPRTLFNTTAAAPRENTAPAGAAGQTPDRTTDAAQSMITSALASLEARPIESRLVLSKALGATDVSPADKQHVRDALTKINETLVFGPTTVPGDPYAVAYNVQAGDLLQKIVRKHSLQVDWRLIARINNVDPRRIRVGQRLKLITGPFHCVVSKSDFRLDLYLGDGSQQVYVRSFSVGLGEFNSTPEGLFRVRPNSKAVNPAWVNPRTGESFEAEDPKNPIGEYWVGLEAVDEALKDVIGYGIHGTTDPDSVGREKSMGCIRLHDADIELLYELLIEETSLVRIGR